MDSKQLINHFSMDKYKFLHKKITGNAKFLSPCIGYVLSGHGRFLYGGKSYTANVGDLIYIAAGTRYYSVWFGDPDIEFYSINYSFSGRQTMAEYKFQIIKNYPAQLFHDMYNKYDNKEFLCISAFYEILNDLNKTLIPTEKNTSLKNIEPALEYIENHSNEDISISDLCNICCCSESTMFKSFQNTVGVSPIKYKHNIMIQTALRLLADTDLSIEEISVKCGFSSSNYFRKTFKEITGTTPKKLR